MGSFGSQCRHSQQQATQGSDVFARTPPQSEDSGGGADARAGVRAPGFLFRGARHVPVGGAEREGAPEGERGRRALRGRRLSRRRRSSRFFAMMAGRCGWGGRSYAGLGWPRRGRRAARRAGERRTAARGQRLARAGYLLRSIDEWMVSCKASRLVGASFGLG